MTRHLLHRYYSKTRNRCVRYTTYALIVLLTACGSTEPSSIAGAYNLTTINGQPLPYTTPGISGGYTTHAGTLVIANGGTFTQTFVASVGGGSSSPQTSAGTYTQSGSSLSMRYTGGATDMSATVSGGTITLQHTNIGTMVFSNH